MTIPLNGEPVPDHIARPNKLHYHHGTTNFTEHFGAFHGATPHCLVGDGHDPCIELRFTFGFRVDITPADFAKLLREGPAALAKLPFIPSIHDAVLEQEG